MKNLPLLLMVDALALIGVVGFSVAAAVEPDESLYLYGQIGAAAVLLVSVLIQRQRRRRMDD